VSGRCSGGGGCEQWFRHDLAAEVTPAAEGVDLCFSTLAGQVGTCAAAPAPIYALIRPHVLAAQRLHG
jgi:hypothetical protein